MTWCEDWPFIGLEQNGDGIGEPVESWPLPLPEVDAPYELTADDDFSKGLGIQWQWQANPKKEWYTAENGALTLPVLPCARGESAVVHAECADADAAGPRVHDADDRHAGCRRQRR